MFKYMYILLVRFYGISTLVGNVIPNPVCTHTPHTHI